MTYTLRILTEDARDLVVAAMRAEAAKRTRVAQGAALALAEERALKRDVRSSAVKVADLLAEAGRLDQLADELANTPDVPVVSGPVPPMAVTDPANAVVLTDLEEHLVEAAATGTDLDAVDSALADEAGDGLSDAAHAAMRRAEQFAEEHLDPDGADVVTNALVEDDPDALDDTDPTVAAIKAADADVLDGALR